MRYYLITLTNQVGQQDDYVITAPNDDEAFQVADRLNLITNGQGYLVEFFYETP